ncbi:uncharacterized protein [Henckelia pumila]|uniref:uncharacterized protein isoform X2 n=1 Tax=Henckelia pumila TaxID=405737 RepID=UPI003C6E309F
MAEPGIRAMRRDELRRLKNFHLQRLIKLNQVFDFSFLTFRAKSGESADPRFFRAVVNPQIDGIEVLLCEIKDGHEMLIPEYHIECPPRIPTRDGDHLSCAWFGLPNYSSDGVIDACDVVDAYDGLAVGEGNVYLSTIELYSKSAGYRSVEDPDLSDLRRLCDIYMDPRKAQCGGGVTQFYADHDRYARDWAKEALNVYNQKKQKNFYLEKVVKLNLLSMYAYLTFWPRSDESVERRLFRGVVGGPSEVLLCEIKDDEEIIIPAGH